MYIFFVPLIVLLIVAVYFDLTTNRIPNWLTLPGAALGAVVFIPWFGFGVFFEHLLGALIVGGVWFLFWQLGFMGGGDQKLMLMAGAWLGHYLAAPVLLAVAICGGAQAIIWTMYQRHRQPHLSWRQALKQTRIPYSLAIMAGSLAVIIGMWQGSNWLTFFSF